MERALPKMADMIARFVERNIGREVADGKLLAKLRNDHAVCVFVMVCGEECVVS